jgi:hypothetical protein
MFVLAARDATVLCTCGEKLRLGEREETHTQIIALEAQDMENLTMLLICN